MKNRITLALETFLEQGYELIGETLIRKESDRFYLMHFEDEFRTDLKTFTKPEEARIIALYDEEGNYRPLKSAPNLKHGWKLILKDIFELHEALDYLYPAMLGGWVAFANNKAAPVNFRETANRQSGMYEMVKHISNNAADSLIGEFCKSDGKCLKTILWKLDQKTSITTLPAEKFDPAQNQLNPDRASGKAIPMLCFESCTLLISAARNEVRETGASV